MSGVYIVLAKRRWYKQQKKCTDSMSGAQIIQVKRRCYERLQIVQAEYKWYKQSKEILKSRILRYVNAGNTTLILRDQSKTL